LPAAGLAALSDLKACGDDLGLGRAEGVDGHGVAIPQNERAIIIKGMEPTNFFLLGASSRDFYPT
jgi:hypothetical protein